MNTTKKYPILLGHNDAILRYYLLECADEDLLTSSPYEAVGKQDFFARNAHGHIDFPRAQEGGFVGGFFALFAPPPKEVQHYDPHDFPPERWYERYIEPAIDPTYAQRMILSQMSYLFRLERLSQDRLHVIRTFEELQHCFREGFLAAILHIEGAEAIDQNFNALEVFYQAGLRSLGPLWSRPNIFGHGVPLVFGPTPDTGPGLTDAGCDLVRECNRLGILLDLSHLNEQGFWDVARLSNAPLVATHSNAYALSHSPRNLIDKQLDAIKETGGVVGINFQVYDLREDGTGNVDTPLETVVRHVNYLVEHLGIDSVALGSDFDGATIPQEIGDVSGLPRLMAALASSGYNESALKKIAYENWIRVLRETWHD